MATSSLVKLIAERTVTAAQYWTSKALFAGGMGLVRTPPAVTSGIRSISRISLLPIQTEERGRHLQSFIYPSCL
jgi:hypothetical protein